MVQVQYTKSSCLNSDHHSHLKNVFACSLILKVLTTKLFALNKQNLKLESGMGLTTYKSGDLHEVNKKSLSNL